jgi:hypothetical protein
MRIAPLLILLLAVILPPAVQADALESAVKRGKPDRIRYTIAAGADVNKRYSRNQTLLHIAAARGTLPAVQVLVENGANLNAQDSNGDTPLHIAVANDRLAVLKFLLTQGADYRIRNKAGRDVVAHADIVATQLAGDAAGSGSTIDQIVKYLADTIPKLPPPGGTGATAAGAAGKPALGETDPEDTIVVDLGRLNITPEFARPAARAALNLGGWVHIGSEASREVGSYFHRKRDREYRAEILFQGNQAKISYLRDFSSSREKLLEKIARNFGRELEKLRQSRVTASEPQRP